ncbi:MAG: regulatory protein LuxR:Response regulator receiver [Proteobacteria bacterium]|nr:regulatory protein LuxR:Response regulator receiver [Pseudomonadota bacterium]
MPKIYIVDDEEAMRDSLTWLLEGESYETENFASAEDFLSALNEDMAGCLILDVRMPEMSGLELHERLLAMGNHLPVIFITGHGDVPMAVSALQRGACDFIQKPFNDQDLLARIKRALTLDCQRAAQRERDGALLQRVKQLSAREFEVMQLVAEGKLNKQIADELDISMKTVEAHRARTMEKMSARTIADLVKINLMLEKLGYKPE